MSSLPAVFSFQETPVRTVVENGDPWFCLTDACRVLDIGDPSRFARSEWCDKDGTSLRRTVDSAGRANRLTFISEPNLYALIARSRKKEAIAFQRWVTHEVLPAIRKTGQYAPQSAPPVAPALPSDIESKVEKLQDRAARIVEFVAEEYEASVRTARQLSELSTVVAEQGVLIAKLLEMQTRPSALAGRAVLPPNPDRAALNQAVLAMGRRHGISRREAWSNLYKRHWQESGRNLHADARKRGVSKLDLAEELGLLGELYAIAEGL